MRTDDVHSLVRNFSLRALWRGSDTQVKKALGKRLRAAREAAGFKHANDFARVLGREEHTYRSWERGQYMPDIPTLTRICQLLNVEPNYLLPLALKKKSDTPNPQSSHNRAA